MRAVPGTLLKGVGGMRSILNGEISCDDFGADMPGGILGIIKRETNSFPGNQKVSSACSWLQLSLRSKSLHLGKIAKLKNQQLFIHL